MLSHRGIIFDIQRFSVKDGPGIRTTVFLKGCPLRCLWCFNPEGQSSSPEIMFYEDKCKKCFTCIDVCSKDAIKYKNNLVKIDRVKCDICGKCEEVCCFGAIEIVGKYFSVEEIISEIMRDKKFYDNSNGGVTLSGGEVTLQTEFSLEVLKRCRAKGVHIAIETCGYSSWSNFNKMLPYVDLVLYDLKHIDRAKHKEYTGVQPDLIYSNLKKIDKRNKPVWIRIPIVPEYTDDEKNLAGIAEFISKLQSVKRVELLPYQLLGVSKYRSLGLKYPLGGLKTYSEQKMERLGELVRSIVGNYVEVKIS